MSSVAEKQVFESWCVIELMGHIRTAGLVTEEERFGAKMGRCDVPKADGGFTTFYFGGSSVFRMTPCSEEAARAVAKGNEPRPVHQWELPSLPRPKAEADPHIGFDPDDEPEDEDDDR